LRRVKKMGHQE